MSPRHSCSKELIYQRHTGDASGKQFLTSVRESSIMFHKNLKFKRSNTNIGSNNGLINTALFYSILSRSVVMEFLTKRATLSGVTHVDKAVRDSRDHA
jgi:hypothetical protein